MEKIDRRYFCKKSLNTAVALGFPGLLIACEKGSPDDNYLTRPIPIGDSINAIVSAVRGLDLDQMTRDAIDEIGGMSSVVDPGETVFIKPNFVNFPWAKTNNCFRNGECTKPEIIIATAEECLKAGADKVVIGEGSHLYTFDWKYAITFDGQRNLVDETARLNREYGDKLSLACLENDSPEWIDVESETRDRKIAISSLAANADKIISLPVAKTHSWAELTLGTKNFIGITPLSKYAQLIDGTWYNRGSFDHSTPQSISQVFLDITRGLNIALTIVDFSIGLDGDGPTLSNGGRTLDIKDKIGSWAVIASKDIMAADATAARIMQHNVMDTVQLVMGYHMQIGEIREECIEIKGEKIENLESFWQKATLKR
jgi:uncharacterized protein (DUF362 family)